MKILLLGEFSGFYKNLFEGLVELGHEVDFIANQDGWKKIDVGKNNIFSHSSNKILRKANSLILQSINIDKLKDYDVVQIIAPNIFGLLKFKYNQKSLNKIIRNNRKSFLSVAGDHYYVYKLYNDLRYSFFKIDKNSGQKYLKKSYIKNNEYILKLVDGIIPTAYTYAEAYRWSDKLLNTIPFPINSSKINALPQKIVNQKLKIFHGINREGFKGTVYIEEAMNRLKVNYPSEVDILIDGKMPLIQYIKVLEESNIVVDQALSYSYGMNAIYSMAMGKVVLSGNEPECQQEFGRSNIPVINIKPSVEDIYNKLEKLVLNKKSVIDIGQKSCLFVEDFHHHVKVAQKYIDTWNSVEVKK